jgi:hypothetical protein
MTLVVWTILSLSITNGDFTLVGQYPNQPACLRAIADKQPPEGKAHIHQCVRIDYDDLRDYAKETKEWKQLNPSKH